MFAVNNRIGDVAQMGERLLCKEEVRGSSPLISIEARLRLFTRGIDLLNQVRDI